MIILLDIVAIGLTVILNGRAKAQQGEQVETEEIFSKLSFVAVGDNLIHEEIYNQADKRSIDGYDFTYAYEYVKDLVWQTDFALINQESLVSSEHNISGYPQYNSPTQLADEISSIGFNVINMANNHCLDFGEKGLLSSYEYWKSKNAIITGVYSQREDLGKVTVANINGIRVAFLGFTQSTNNKSLPADSSAYIVTSEGESDLRQMLSNAKENADVTVVMAHWGMEYSGQVTSSQKELAQKISDWGADVIIGSHTHVLSDVEYITGQSGNRTLVAYSLGNFISASKSCDELLGGMLFFNATKNNVTGEVSIDGIRLEGCVTHYGYDLAGIRVYPLSEYTDDLAKRHGIYDGGEWSLSKLKKAVNKCFNIN